MNYRGVMFRKRQIKTKVLTGLTFFLFLALANLTSCSGMAKGTPSVTVDTRVGGATQPHFVPTLPPTVHAYADSTTRPHPELEPTLSPTVHADVDGTAQPHPELEPTLSPTVHADADSTTQPHPEPELGVTVYTRADGTLMVNDEPFFPIGMYHTSWYGTVEGRLAALQNMAAAGFNLIHPQFDKDDTPFLDQAAALGVYVQIGGLGENWQRVVNTYKSHPALMGWYIGDDAEDHYTPEEIQAKHDGVKALDPNHVTSIGIYDPDRFGPYITIPDIACACVYPVDRRPLSRVDQVLSEADTCGQSILGVPQAFAWPDERPPTSVELRNMTYQMLINGVKGLLYYTYFDGNWNIEDHPDLWAELIAMIPEFKALSSVYMDGTRTKINDTGAQDVFAAQWIYENQSYVILVNTSDQTRDVSFSLPSAITGELQPMFAGRPDGLVYADGVLSGSIVPLEVHVYEIGPRQ
jgi:hypothetical protein